MLLCVSVCEGERKRERERDFVYDMNASLRETNKQPKRDRWIER